MVEYAFAAQGGQAVLLRRRLRPSQDSKAPQMGGGLFSQPRIPSGMSLYLYATLGQNFEKVEEWTPRIYYPGNGAPEDDEVLNEVRNCVEWQVAELANRLNG